jgi:hypothetical protein
LFTTRLRARLSFSGVEGLLMKRARTSLGLHHGVGVALLVRVHADYLRLFYW